MSIHEPVEMFPRPEFWRSEEGRSISRMYQITDPRICGKLKQLVSDTSLIVEPYLLQMLGEKYYLIPDLDNKSEFNEEGLWRGLGKYDAPRREQPNPEVWREAVKLAYSAFAGRGVLTPQKDEGAVYKSLRLTKGSGFPHLISKKDAFDKDFIMYKRYLGGKRIKYPCMPYHRIQHGEYGPKVRLVWGYPSSVTMLEGIFARPLINYFLTRSTPMSMGQRKFEIAAKAISIQNSGVKYGLDFSGFDSSLSKQFILTAFRILKTHFMMDESDERAWNSVVNYFIDTPILMPDGWVYSKHHGVPSGSFFTQLIDSICNYIAVQYIFLSLTGKKVENKRLQILGDDSRFSTTSNVATESIASIASHLGLVLNVKKSEKAYGNNLPSYLGHNWVFGVVSRPLRENVKRLVFPEAFIHHLTGRERIVERLSAVLTDNRDAMKILRDVVVVPTKRKAIEYSFRHASDFVQSGLQVAQTVAGKYTAPVSRPLHIFT